MQRWSDRDRLESWRHTELNQNRPNSLSAIGTSTSNLNPLTHIRIALSKCNDSAPAEATPGLAFIKDDDLRESLRTDIAEADRALINSEWKAATVLSGSVIEALLLWALQQEKAPAIQTAISNVVAAKRLRNKPNNDLTWWVLIEFIEVAGEMKIISKETTDQANLAREFRNFIHAGKIQRLSKECNRGTALSAVSGVEHVITDLEKKYP